ncbi:MAG: radical SAM family heme chaperone HemW [Bacteroidota bacterium]
MAGIYLHIPFCHQACTYCDFHFVTSFTRKKEMVKAIQQELRLRKDFFPEGTTLKTIYFGGGTPSVLSQKELASILETIYKHFSVTDEAEVTLEANPEDINSEKLNHWKKAGINRLSMGIQSFHDEHLKWMNRLHTGKQAMASVRMAQDAGIENITIDLIMGIPEMSQGQWEENLTKACSLGTPHMSVYALTVEPKTALSHQVKKQLVRLPEEEDVSWQFLKTHEWLTDQGYQHYEISNYSLSGQHSRHNSSYWDRKAYLGVGPSAHSFRENTRSWNIANNAKYLQALAKEELPMAETEVLETSDVYHEYVMTGLRKANGISDQWVKSHMGFSLKEKFSEEIRSWEVKGLCRWEGDQLSLTPEGWIIADHLITELFL